MNEELTEAIENLRDTQVEMTDRLGQMAEILERMQDTHDLRDADRDRILEEIRDELRAAREAEGQG